MAMHRKPGEQRSPRFYMGGYSKKGNCKDSAVSSSLVLTGYDHSLYLEPHRRC